MSELTITPGEDQVEKAGAEERRRSNRHSCPRVPFVRFLVKPGFQCRQAMVRDVSMSGLGMYNRSRLEPGSVLALQLLATRPGISYIRSAKVVYAVPDGDCWLIGCEFTRELTDEELLSLG